MIPKERVEYDGYYLIDVVAKAGHKSIVPARGYNLKSWLNFEKSLGSQAVHRQVTETEYMKYHWSGTPYEEEPKKKAVKKTTEKSAKKATVKKTVKKAAVKKAVKKTTVKTVKKAVKKPATKSKTK